MQPKQSPFFMMKSFFSVDVSFVKLLHSAAECLDFSQYKQSSLSVSLLPVALERVWGGPEEKVEVFECWVLVTDPNMGSLTISACLLTKLVNSLKSGYLPRAALVSKTWPLHFRNIQSGSFSTSFLKYWASFKMVRLPISRAATKHCIRKSANERRAMALLGLMGAQASSLLRKAWLTIKLFPNRSSNCSSAC